MGGDNQVGLASSNLFALVPFLLVGAAFGCEHLLLLHGELGQLDLLSPLFLCCGSFLLSSGQRLVAVLKAVPLKAEKQVTLADADRVVGPACLS